MVFTNLQDRRSSGSRGPYRPLRREAIIPMLERPSGVPMLTHAQIWSAIDRLAARAGLTASGLARRAGLDPTTFNKSKRITAAGRARWPSTESIAKALAATETPLETFVGLVDGGGVTEADGAAAGPARLPAADGCRQIAIPSLNHHHACALQISGRAMEPAYRDGDIILVSLSA